MNVEESDFAERGEENESKRDIQNSEHRWVGDGGDLKVLMDSVNDAGGYVVSKMEVPESPFDLEDMRIETEHFDKMIEELGKQYEKVEEYGSGISKRFGCTTKHPSEYVKDGFLGWRRFLM